MSWLWQSHYINAAAGQGLRAKCSVRRLLTYTKNAWMHSINKYNYNILIILKIILIL